MMDIVALLNELQSIARTGLSFTSSTYDQERYKRLLELALQGYEQLLNQPIAELKPLFSQELGYITPKIGADAAIFNEQGEILLMERADGTGWCLPCGWVEANEKPSETVLREVREETGLEVVVKQLVGVFTRPANAQNGPHTMIAVVHWCEIVAGELTLSAEGKALQYWGLNDVPLWHATHEKYARFAHHMWQAQTLLPAVSD